MNIQLMSNLKKLRLSGLASTLEVRLQEAAGNQLNHQEFLELIGSDRAQPESAAWWTDFLQRLSARGLKGNQLQLITMDGGQGLWAAVREVYPMVPHQLCWVHKMRNVAK